MIVLDVENGNDLDNYLDYFTSQDIVYLSPGVYHLSTILKLQKHNFIFKGTTDQPNDIHIYQKTNTELLLVKANNITITGISFHMESTSDKICATFASCNNCKVSNCNFYGNDNNFTVFFAGPSYLIEGNNTINGYLNNDLNSGNIFEYNSIYSKFNGDAASFSLQNNGSFINNNLVGCKLAIYMDRNCNISGNTISYSNNNGIFFSLPLENILVENNFINHCEESGMVFRLQLEHGEFINDTHNITVISNVINRSNYMGIECNYTDNINIVNNSIISPTNYPFYTYECSDINMNNNKVVFAKQPVRIENTRNVSVSNNNISISDLHPAPHSVFIVSSDNINIHNNIVTGETTSVNINQIDSTCSESNNNVIKYSIPEISKMTIEYIIVQ